MTGRTQTISPTSRKREGAESPAGSIPSRAVTRLARRPGEKGERYEQELGSGADDEKAQPEAAPAAERPSLEQRVAQLEEEVARLRALIDRD
jgi:uncharacterized protein YceH (UPF0502 family)